MSTNSRHLGRGESGCPVPCGAEPDTTFKDQLLLRTYPGTERSSLPTAGMHDLVQIFQLKARMPLTSDPGSSGYVSSSRCLGTRKSVCAGLWPASLNSSETCCMDEAAASAINRSSPKK